MIATTVRVAASLAFAILVLLYAWIALRSDNLLSTLPFLPSPITIYFDMHPLARNFPAFAFLGFLGAAAFSTARLEWAFVAFLCCLCAPFIKDFAQIFVLTRHFSWNATFLGMLGVLVGWAIGWFSARCIAAGVDS